MSGENWKKIFWQCSVQWEPEPENPVFWLVLAHYQAPSKRCREFSESGSFWFKNRSWPITEFAQKIHVTFPSDWICVYSLHSIPHCIHTCFARDVPLTAPYQCKNQQYCGKPPEVPQLHVNMWWHHEVHLHSSVTWSESHHLSCHKTADIVLCSCCKLYNLKVVVAGLAFVLKLSALCISSWEIVEFSKQTATMETHMQTWLLACSDVKKSCLYFCISWLWAVCWTSPPLQGINLGSAIASRKLHTKCNGDFKPVFLENCAALEETNERRRQRPLFHELHPSISCAPLLFTAGVSWCKMKASGFPGPTPLFHNCICTKSCRSVSQPSMGTERPVLCVSATLCVSTWIASAFCQRHLWAESCFSHKASRNFRVPDPTPILRSPFLWWFVRPLRLAPTERSVHVSKPSKPSALHLHPLFQRPFCWESCCSHKGTWGECCASGEKPATFPQTLPHFFLVVSSLIVLNHDLSNERVSMCMNWNVGTCANPTPLFQNPFRCESCCPHKWSGMGLWCPKWNIWCSPIRHPVLSQ